MTTFDLRFRVQCANVQKATALRNRIAELLDDDEETVVKHVAVAQPEQSWSVVGVDTETGEPFEETVEAETAEDAAAAVATETRIVASRPTPVLAAA